MIGSPAHVRRTAVLLAVALAGCAGGLVLPGAGQAASVALPHRLSVDENDQGTGSQPYSLRPSHDPVAAGRLQFYVYNFGQDAHTFAIVGRRGRRLAFAHAPSGDPADYVEVDVKLRPGRYLLECTLPGHAHLGMRSWLTVR